MPLAGLSKPKLSPSSAGKGLQSFGRTSKHPWALLPIPCPTKVSLSHAAAEPLHFSPPNPAQLWVKPIVTLTFVLYPLSSAPQKRGKENNEECVSIHAPPVLCWAWVCAALGGALEPHKAQIWTKTGPSPGALYRNTVWRSRKRWGGSAETVLTVKMMEGCFTLNFGAIT